MKKILTLLLVLFGGHQLAAQNSQIEYTNSEVTGTGLAGIDKTWATATEDGIIVRTFEVDVDDIIQKRRYLLYLPKNYSEEKSYPLIVILHGVNINAEIAREYDTHNDFEPLADEHEFIVVYGNAYSPAPEPKSDPFWANTGAWVNNDGIGVQHDLEYLLGVEKDLESQGIHIKQTEKFLGGISNGGQMTLEASNHLYPHYRAAFAGIPVPVGSTLEHVENFSLMMYTAMKDPLFAEFIDNYGEIMDRVMQTWATTLGISEEDFESAEFTPFKDNIVEGDGYSGEANHALVTTNSTIEHTTLISDSGNQLYLLKSERGGHGIPHPNQFDLGTIENITGYRNQDVNIVHEMWKFFSQFIEE